MTALPLARWDGDRLLWLVAGSLAQGEPRYAEDAALTAAWWEGQARLYGPLFGMKAYEIPASHHRRHRRARA